MNLLYVHEKERLTRGWEVIENHRQTFWKRWKPAPFPVEFPSRVRERSRSIYRFPLPLDGRPWKVRDLYYTHASPFREPIGNFYSRSAATPVFIGYRTRRYAPPCGWWALDTSSSPKIFAASPFILTTMTSWIERVVEGNADRGWSIGICFSLFFLFFFLSFFSFLQ